MMVFIMTLGLMLFGLTCMLLRKRNGKIAFSCDNVFFLVYAIYYGILFPIVYALTANGINKESYS